MCCRLDATTNECSRGRLVNDSHRVPDANMKIMMEAAVPHLCLFAKRELPADEEISHCDGKGVSFSGRVCIKFYKNLDVINISFQQTFL